MNYKQTRPYSLGKNAYLSMRTFQLILRFGCDSHFHHPSCLSLLSMLLCKRKNNEHSFKPCLFYPEEAEDLNSFYFYFFVTFTNIPLIWIIINIHVNSWQSLGFTDVAITNKSQTATQRHTLIHGCAFLFM